MKFKSDAIIQVIYHGPFCLFIYLLFWACGGCLLLCKTKIKYACYLKVILWSITGQQDTYKTKSEMLCHVSLFFNKHGIQCSSPSLCPPPSLTLCSFNPSPLTLFSSSPPWYLATAPSFFPFPPLVPSTPLLPPLFLLCTFHSVRYPTPLSCKPSFIPSPPPTGLFVSWPLFFSLLILPSHFSLFFSSSSLFHLLLIIPSSPLPSSHFPVFSTFPLLSLNSLPIIVFHLLVCLCLTLYISNC